MAEDASGVPPVRSTPLEEPFVNAKVELLIPLDDVSVDDDPEMKLKAAIDAYEASPAGDMSEVATVTFEDADGRLCCGVCGDDAIVLAAGDFFLEPRAANAAGRGVPRCSRHVGADIYAGEATATVAELRHATGLYPRAEAA